MFKSVKKLLEVFNFFDAIKYRKNKITHVATPEGIYGSDGSFERWVDDGRTDEEIEKMKEKTRKSLED